jgi:hypothetical protein
VRGGGLGVVNFNEDFGGEERRCFVISVDYLVEGGGVDGGEGGEEEDEGCGGLDHCRWRCSLLEGGRSSRLFSWWR